MDEELQHILLGHNCSNELFSFENNRQCTPSGSPCEGIMAPSAGYEINYLMYIGFRGRERV